jgi:hypothetical protein
MHRTSGVLMNAVVVPTNAALHHSEARTDDEDLTAFALPAGVVLRRADAGGGTPR